MNNFNFTKSFNFIDTVNVSNVKKIMYYSFLRNWLMVFGNYHQYPFSNKIINFHTFCDYQNYTIML